MNLLNPFTAVTMVAGISVIFSGLFLINRYVKSNKSIRLRSDLARAYGLRSSLSCGLLLITSSGLGVLFNLNDWLLMGMAAAWILVCMILSSVFTERYMKSSFS